MHYICIQIQSKFVLDGEITRIALCNRWQISQGIQKSLRALTQKTFYILASLTIFNMFVWTLISAKLFIKSTYSFVDNGDFFFFDQLTGQPVLIGGTMGTCSYVLTGTQQGMEETYGTTCHGAVSYQWIMNRIKMFI